MPQAIHQIMAGYADGDAISHEAMLLRDIFRRWGCASEIFADPACVSPGLRSDSFPLAAYSARPGDICLHQYGIASPALDVFLNSPAHRVLIYQNITPARYFRGIDESVAGRLETARAALPETARRADAVWATSRFNAEELRAGGVGDVKLLPLFYTPSPEARPADPDVLARFVGTPLKTVLFVGRIAPNKRLEDLIEAFAWYHRCLNPYSRLIVVGSPRSAPRYYTMLRMLAGDWEMPNVCFEGFASAAGLQAYYRVADLYVSASEHEGYCLPLVEAMGHGAPVLARAVGGVPEAMDGAGVLYDGLSPAELGALFDRLLTDDALRREILASQQDRLRRALQRDQAAETRALLAPWLTG
jgi:glycosyltransferase involved in cell wall biosynthesis